MHRDVKSENMLLDTQRNLKIADFGVARVEAQNPKDMTGATGTLGYMAPEVSPSVFFSLFVSFFWSLNCSWRYYAFSIPCCGNRSQTIPD